MKRFIGMFSILICIASAILGAQRPEWNPANIKPCDRTCLVGFMERYKEQLRFSMLTCEEQISSGTFSYMKHIRPRRVLIVDEQKGLVSAWALFVHDGTRRNAPPNAPPGMLQNLVTVETFGIRGGLIHDHTVSATAGRQDPADRDNEPSWQP